MARSYTVYIITNRKYGVLYIGVTNNIGRRLQEHSDRKGDGDSFTKRYNLPLLIYAEAFQRIDNAIHR